MFDNYSRTFEDLIREEDGSYETFKEYHIFMPEISQTTPTNSMSLQQLTHAVNDLEGDEYWEQVVSEDPVKTTAEVYQDLGVISSREKAITQEKIYEIPDYHGKGNTISWENILNRIKMSMDNVEAMRNIREEENDVQTTFEEFNF